MRKLPVGILGATGIVGQHYLTLLANHPWFEVRFLAASDGSAGKSYGEAVRGRWQMAGPIPELLVHRMDDLDRARESCAFLFSAVSSEAANLYEERYAAAGLPVISNCSAHRMAPDVPILIPEVNPGHLKIIEVQQKNRGWKEGFIVTKPNCSLQSYMIPLAPLHNRYRVARLLVTTLQAVSGAGYPGPASLEMIDNVIPWIAGEEEKSEREPLKIWGAVGEQAILPASEIVIAAHCNRVPVIDGHLACVSVEFEERPTRDEILELWSQFEGVAHLPSAPPRPILYFEEEDRPQPRKDRGAGGGMAISVGRLRDCPLLDFRFVALSHNTVRGAAGGGILNAELLVEQGYLEDRS